MNERLTLQNLTDLLAEQKGLTKKDAEIFLRELVSLVSDTIEKNEAVRIKNFGTFKLTQVSARKSVDVNTGEDIEIAAHYRLSFTPDKSLRDEINKPFAHFESTILEEGVRFDQDTPFDQEEDADDSHDVQNIESYEIEEEIMPPLPLPVEELETTEPYNIASPEIQDTPESDTDRISNEKMKENISNILNRGENQLINIRHNGDNKPCQQGSIEERIEKIRRNTSDESYSDTPIENERMTEEDTRKNDITNNTPNTQHENKPIVEPKNEKMNEKKNYDDSYETDDDVIESGYPSNKKTYIYLAILVIAIAAILLTIRYKGDSEAASAAIVTEQTAPDTTPEPVVEEPKDVADLDIAVVKKGETLRILAEKYYGNRVFWVYIFEVNKEKVKNPNKLAIGSKFVIPSLNKFGVDPQNPADKATAQKKEDEYVRKYNFKLR